ncbi:MAG: deacylase [Flavobacteriales bacterium]|nr:MAG: deacylase [Flavobacteriales bacterium]
MKINLYTLLFFVSFFGNAQKDTIPYRSNFTTTELQLGTTLPSNKGFPETGLQKTISLHFGKYQLKNTEEWAYRLKYPTTGMSFAITDYANKENIGYSASMMPFIEFGMFKKKIKGLNFNVSLGVSYFTKSYTGTTFSLNNPIENNNNAISTKVTWSLKSFFYYDFLRSNNNNWRLGVGYFHHSNGHTKFPNQGLNSFLFSVSKQSNYDLSSTRKTKGQKKQALKFEDNLQQFFTIRTGAGLNFLSEQFNDRKGVFTVAPSYGIIFNNTFKIGIGCFYRFYEHYYHYINNSEELIVTQYPHFQLNPVKYSSSLGLFFSGEIFLGNIGMEFDIGYNLFKPFYEVDWKLNGFYWDFINEDGTVETRFVEREITSVYHLKHAILFRAGLKYYLINTNNNPKSNIFIGVHINTNLGQADFTELNLGYVHRFGRKSR